MKRQALAPTASAELTAAKADPMVKWSADTQSALDAFKAALEARGSPETTRRYLIACEQLSGYLGERSIYMVAANDAQRCLAQMHAKGIAPRTLATSLSAWKSWLRVLARSQPALRPDALDTVRVPKAPKRLPNALSETEMARLLATPADAAGRESDVAQSAEQNTFAHRDRAMFELLYGCGLRVSELTGLDLQDIHVDAGEVRVFGKGRKERVLPLGRLASEAIAAWLPERKNLAARLPNADPAALFIGTRGARIAQTTVRTVLASAAIERGIDSHVHPHRLRHSFASHVLQHSRDLRAVQELMGHASIASTQVYTHLDFKHLAAVYDDAHPRAVRKKVKS